MKKLYIFLITIIIITIVIYPKKERIISSFNEIDTSDTYKVFTLTFGGNKASKPFPKLIFDIFITLY